MKCQFCMDEVPAHDIKGKTHLTITKDVEGHIHVHGDLKGKENVKELLEVAAETAGINLEKVNAAVPAEVVFHNRQRIGDMLVFTCGVRDFKVAYPHVRVNVISTAGHIFDHNPHIDRTLVPTPQNTVKIGPSELTNASNRLDWHFCNAFRVSMEKYLKVPIPQGESRPDIWLTQEEYDAPRLWEKPYWIISTSGEKGWGCKMYPHSEWQLFIEQMEIQHPDMLFVQIGTAEDNAPRLQGKNVIDWIGKTQSRDNGIRDLFKLFLNAEGSIGLVSFHMHLSGALSKPALVIAGGREPVHFTRYPGHAYLSTDGMLPCSIKACWHCNIDACTNLVLNPTAEQVGDRKVPKCVDIIGHMDLVRALNNYYLGGRLQKGFASPKMKFKNVVPTPKKPVQVTPEVQTFAAPKELYGMTFGGGSLTDKDWDFIQSVINKYKVKTVLEFGAGLSTLLFNDVPGLSVATWETKRGWINKIQELNPKCNIGLWAGDVMEIDPAAFNFDLCFVDGPAGDKAREESTRIAAKRADVVIIHDAGREWARKYQDEFLKPYFDGPGKGGHRCHLWVRKGKVTPELEKKEIVQPGKDLQGKQGTIGGCYDQENEEGIQDCQHVGQEAQQRQSEQSTSAEALGADRVFQNKALKRIKIVSTARGWGGQARSVTTLMRMLLAEGHSVEFIPFRNTVGSSELKAMLAGELKDVKVTLDFDSIKEGCDCLLVYADDYVWEFPTPAMAEAFADVGADRKIMMLNYRRGKVGEVLWTKGWDKYMFLNSTQEKELLAILPGVATKVLPPCTDLTPFFNVDVDYEGALRLVRHSSQGDTKFPKDIGDCMHLMRLAQTCTISMLPGPSFVPVSDWFFKSPRTADPQVIANFLATGNLFWYSLPVGYMDMGPRVIIEAMAAGLPVLADNWGGALDRVTPETGWLCANKKEFAGLLSGMTPKILRQKGEAARVRAFEEFAPEAWIRELLG